MKYISSALVLLALFGNQEQVNAIRVKASFTDDLVKSLAEEMQKDVEEVDTSSQTPPPPAAGPPQPAPGHAQNPKAPSSVYAGQKKSTPATHANNNSTTPAAATAQKHQAVAQKKSAVVIKKKAEEEEIPMDAAAIKAYSSVIADAAEDSEPQVPVQYTAVNEDEAQPAKHDDKLLGSDPMGSMIQNEITSIKMASIKAAEE